MKVLVACEYSGIVRDAFAARGFDAMSCDLLPSDAPGKHYQGDVRGLLHYEWDLLIAHPDCTYLCSSGLHWNSRVPGRQEKTEQALLFVRELLGSNARRICLENPVGCISTRIRKPDQYIQPYEYGHDASKRTGLWLKNLPLLRPTQRVPGRMVNGKERWGNQTDSGQNKLGPSDDRWKERARTYQGWADAMASQWGDYLNLQHCIDVLVGMNVGEDKCKP
jgi:hypothetical protein